MKVRIDAVRPFAPLEPTLMSRRPNLPPLTALRFFPALLVVIFHYNSTRSLFSAAWADFGYEAVTFFFVLSGFILAYAHGVTTEGVLNISLSRFVMARIVKICPLYYLAVLLIICLFAVADIFDRLAIFETALVLLFVQSWIPSAALSLNPPAWSLSNEMFFYLLFPAIWGMTRYLNAASAMAFAAVLVVLVDALRQAFSSGGADWHSFIWYFPLLNLPQFILGMALGYMYLSARGGRSTHTGYFLAGLAALAAIILSKSMEWQLPGTVLCATFGLIIFGAAGISGILGRLLSRHYLVMLGEASYAIYILHYPILLWWNHYTRVVYQLNWYPGAEFALYLAIVISTSVAALLWLERPARRLAIG